MPRSTVFEQTARESGRSKPARVSGLDVKQSNDQMSKEQSNSLRALQNTLSKRYDRNRHYYSFARFSFPDSDGTRVFGVIV
ncbi:MAG TPA: hypothetical protein VNI35_00475 [Nitrospira sp.]|nr:hypothetical protein [Nitrospira sp.]